MARDILTGTRIRERRTAQGLKQADLAVSAGISASYLNLIEHNKRRIGGKLLLAIARALDVEPSVLTDGAESSLLAALREAAARDASGRAELERIDEFAGRFPGWAALVDVMQSRVVSLEQQIAALNDRLTHDPHLATALHEMLSNVTAIRSTAGILADDADIPPEWRGRFHRNINEDAQRLAESSTALVRYLESEEGEGVTATPQEDVDAWLEARGHHFAEIEADPEADLELLVLNANELTSAVARDLGLRALSRYRDMSRAFPLSRVASHIADNGDAPDALADAFGQSLGAALFRLATLPDQSQPVGFVIADASGTLLYRKPLDHFPLPRFGAACALWPLFSALTRPGQPLAEVIHHAAREARYFETYAVAEPVEAGRFNAIARVEAAMLIRPFGGEPPDSPRSVGVSCRICTRGDCPARREPSIIA